MNIQIHIEVSDRNEVESTPGLHGQLLFRDGDRGKEFTLLGTATLADEAELGSVQVVDDDLHLDPSLATTLLTAAFYDCWNAVVIDGHVMAGLRWKPLLLWLSHHVTEAKAAEVLAIIEICFGVAARQSG